MVEIVGRIERDFNGDFVRAHCALFDITDRKKMEDEKARLNLFLEQEVELRTKELADAVKALRELATHDPLTGLANRLAATGRLETEFAMFQRTRRPFSILMIDVDDFKTINDSLGHAAGDRALKQLSEIFNASLRVSDLVARLGGDEFMAILPDAGLSAAMVTAEKLRAAVAGSSLHNVTVSIGVTTASATDEVYDGVLQRADGHLYEAKRMGRNRIFPDG
jgi:diguanylate cyclase (GGDEF)-like protein